MVDIRLIKPLKGHVVNYQGELLQRSETHMVVLAHWAHKPVDLGFVAFLPGDQLYEHFYSDRWYNVYKLHTVEGTLKGWYCNITRPALFGENSIESEDLELDLFVSPDRRTMLLLDEDEYAARDLVSSDPAAHHAALAALEELRNLAECGAGPFALE